MFRGGQERLTFSVLWEMTPEAEVLSTTFTKALIKSKAAFTYADAQVGRSVWEQQSGKTELMC
jgi:exosome complex exonuclease DIS3/RRP44